MYLIPFFAQDCGSPTTSSLSDTPEHGDGDNVPLVVYLRTSSNTNTDILIVRLSNEKRRFEGAANVPRQVPSQHSL